MLWASRAAIEICTKILFGFSAFGEGSEYSAVS